MTARQLATLLTVYSAPNIEFPRCGLDHAVVGQLLRRRLLRKFPGAVRVTWNGELVCRQVLAVGRKAAREVSQ